MSVKSVKRDPMHSQKRPNNRRHTVLLQGPLLFREPSQFLIQVDEAGHGQECLQAIRNYQVHRLQNMFSKVSALAYLLGLRIMV